MQQCTILLHATAGNCTARMRVHGGRKFLQNEQQYRRQLFQYVNLPYACFTCAARTTIKQSSPPRLPHTPAGQFFIPILPGTNTSQITHFTRHPVPHRCNRFEHSSPRGKFATDAAKLPRGGIRAPRQTKDVLIIFLFTVCNTSFCFRKKRYYPQKTLCVFLRGQDAMGVAGHLE